MRITSGRRIRGWAALIAPLLLAGALAGCEGDDGKAGADGATGATGPAGTAGTPGLNCWDLNGNGIPDLATEDINKDGVVDVNDCRPPSGAYNADSAVKWVRSLEDQELVRIHGVLRGAVAGGGPDSLW